MCTVQIMYCFGVFFRRFLENCEQVENKTSQDKKVSLVSLKSEHDKIAHHLVNLDD